MVFAWIPTWPWWLDKSNSRRLADLPILAETCEVSLVEPITESPNQKCERNILPWARDCFVGSEMLMTPHQNIRDLYDTSATLLPNTFLLSKSPWLTAFAEHPLCLSSHVCLNIHFSPTRSWKPGQTWPLHMVARHATDHRDHGVVSECHGTRLPITSTSRNQAHLMY